MNRYNKRIETFSPFRVNTKYKSYLIPALKVILAAALICVSMTWNSFWVPDDRRVRAAVSVAGLLVAFVCAYIICVSVGEMGFVGENRERAKVLKNDPSEYKTKYHSTAEILGRFEESHDIELLAVIGGKLTYLGVRTAYSKAAGYHNKRYYINDDDYIDSKEFSDALAKRTNSAAEIAIASVDGKTV